MAADAAILETITAVVVDATMAVATVFLEAITIAVFGSLSYCSSSAAITTIVAVVATMAVATVSLAATTITAASGLSGSSCFPASAEIIMAAANPC